MAPWGQGIVRNNKKDGEKSRNHHSAKNDCCLVVAGKGGDVVNDIESCFGLFLLRKSKDRLLDHVPHDEARDKHDSSCHRQRENIPTENKHDYSLSNLAYLGDSALTTIHEQGHIYGIEDYYDYSYMIDTIGGYDMQDMNVGDWNSFSKMSLGWVDPLYLELKPGEEETLTLKPTTLGGSPLVLKDGWNGSAYDEYVMIDLWNREGNGSFGGIEGYEAKYDDLGAAGARVYHVDARLWQYTSDYNFWSGAYVRDLDLVRPETYNYQLAHTNTYYMNDYPTYNVAYDGSGVSTYHLLDLIQAGGSNTFSNTLGRQYLTASDFFQSGDAFSMGTYGNAFFYEGSTLNDGSMFRYIVSFENVTSEQATVKISAI